MTLWASLLDLGGVGTRWARGTCEHGGLSQCWLKCGKLTSVFLFPLQLLFCGCISWEIRNYRGHTLTSPSSCSFSPLLHRLIHKHHSVVQDFGLWLKIWNSYIFWTRVLRNQSYTQLSELVGHLSDLFQFESSVTVMSAWGFSGRRSVSTSHLGWRLSKKLSLTDTLRCIANGAVERNVWFILANVVPSSYSRKCVFVRIKLVYYGMVVVGISVWV